VQMRDGLSAGSESDQRQIFHTVLGKRARSGYETSRRADRACSIIRLETHDEP
jgi:hypothetical protein